MSIRSLEGLFLLEKQFVSSAKFRSSINNSVHSFIITDNKKFRRLLFNNAAIVKQFDKYLVKPRRIL